MISGNSTHTKVINYATFNMFVIIYFSFLMIFHTVYFYTIFQTIFDKW